MKADSGNYTCAPQFADAASVAVHVVNGKEKEQGEGLWRGERSYGGEREGLWREERGVVEGRERVKERGEDGKNTLREDRRRIKGIYIYMEKRREEEGKIGREGEERKGETMEKHNRMD